MKARFAEQLGGAAPRNQDTRGLLSPLSPRPEDQEEGVKFLNASEGQNCEVQTQLDVRG